MTLIKGRFGQRRDKNLNVNWLKRKMRRGIGDSYHRQSFQEVFSKKEAG